MLQGQTISHTDLDGRGSQLHYSASEVDGESMSELNTSQRHEGGHYSSARLGGPIDVQEAYGHSTSGIRAGAQDVVYTLTAPTEPVASSKRD